MQYARIADGIVQELGTLRSLQSCIPVSYGWPTPAAPRGSATATLTASSRRPRLPSSRCRAAKGAAIDEAFDTALEAGLSFGGKIIQIDDASRINIAGATTRAIGVVAGVSGLTWPDGFYWRTGDNSALPLTAARCWAMGQASADRYTVLVLNRGSLRDATPRRQRSTPSPRSIQRPAGRDERPGPFGAAG